MLDPKLIKENPQSIKNMLKARGVDYDLERLIAVDQKRREDIQKTDELRKKKNEVGLKISEYKKVGKDATELLTEMKRVSEKLSELEQLQIENEKKYRQLAFTIPNIIHESVPIGKDESANKLVKDWGKIPKFDFEPKNHIDIAENLGLIDLERAAKVAGARFYYLKDDLVRLNQALIHYAIDYLVEKNYSLVQPPYMIKKRGHGRSSNC